MDGYNNADLSVMDSATLTTLIAGTKAAINLRLQGNLPETAEQVVINGLQCWRTPLEYLTQYLYALTRAQAIQASSNGGLNIARAVRGDGGMGGMPQRRSSWW